MIDITYHPGKTTVVADTLNRNPVVCRARLSSMGIRYQDQREDVLDRLHVVVLARLMISPIVVDHIIQAQADDDLLKQ